LLFAGGTSCCDLRGGTDVSFSPPLDFVRRVLLPTLQRMGGGFDIDCVQRGFFPRGGGRVRLVVPGLAMPLSPIDLSERGEPQHVEAVLYATRSIGTEEVASIEAVRDVVQHLAPRSYVNFSQAPAPERTFKCWVDIVITTTTGALFHGGSDPKDLPAPGKGGGGGKASSGGLPALFATATREACEPLAEQLRSGAAVDLHLLDQLVLPASLAQGKSRLLAAELSMHAQTAIHIAELIVPGVRFTPHKRGKLNLIEIDGIGHVCAAGMTPVAAPAATTVSAKDGRKSGKGTAPAGLAATPESEDEYLQLEPGALSAAAQGMLADFENDMRHLSNATGAQVFSEVPRDRLVLRGAPQKRDAARNELRQVLAFYFGGR